MLDFDRVQAALEGLGADVDAAEAHGTLCALLLDNCDLPLWLGHTLDDMPDSADVLGTERLTVLGELFELTQEQFGNEDLGFELLLPDDTDDFGLRLLGLSSWCQGFLYGFGVNGRFDESTLDEEARECLSDLLEISKLSHDEEGNDVAEQQLVEIIEHVRVAALILNESLNPLKPPLTVH
jgi:uncharacterized protein YgfB (UPF0149 family)